MSRFARLSTMFVAGAVLTSTASAQDGASAMLAQLDQPSNSPALLGTMLQFCYTAARVQQGQGPPAYSAAVTRGANSPPFSLMQPRLTWDSPSLGECRARYIGPLAKSLWEKRTFLAQSLDGAPALCQPDAADYVCVDEALGRDGEQRATYQVKVRQTGRGVDLDAMLTSIKPVDN